MPGMFQARALTVGLGTPVGEAEADQPTCPSCHGFWPLFRAELLSPEKVTLSPAGSPSLSRLQGYSFPLVPQQDPLTLALDSSAQVGAPRVMEVYSIEFLLLFPLLFIEI